MPAGCRTLNAAGCDTHLLFIQSCEEVCQVRDGRLGGLEKVVQ